MNHERSPTVGRSKCSCGRHITGLLVHRGDNGDLSAPHRQSAHKAGLRFFFLGFSSQRCFTLIDLDRD